MDPSEEKPARPKPVAKKNQFFLPAILIILLLVAIGGILSFFNSSSAPPLTVPEQEQKGDLQPVAKSVAGQESESEQSAILSAEPVNPVSQPFSRDARDSGGSVSAEQEYEISAQETSQRTSTVPKEHSSLPRDLPEETEKVSVCSQPEQRLKAFYTHLDNQPYMKSYHLTTSSQDHFTALIKKILDNPPEITGESNDLYTILKNTAHFFRVSGKDNIVMLQGILNSEKDKLEQILADYYLLITTPECSSSQYVDYINRDALYEYACFFLNTMGGRLYLFRRDSLSRMNVTYYAILLVDLANLQQNNRYGIPLKLGVNMLTSEMERGGASMKGIEGYLDTLYDLKEKYQ